MIVIVSYGTLAAAPCGQGIRRPMTRKARARRRPWSLARSHVKRTGRH